mmetsp:Transcript_7755/g.32350  ORF Transcript_7755/g.32350 Transcript_7755/m.32350 type:complete len:219 (+) Transcript_7755:1432-2088(+)
MNGAGVGAEYESAAESTSESERTSSAFSNENRDDACANVSGVAPSGSQSKNDSVSDPNEYGSSQKSLFSFSFSFAARVEREAFFFAVSSACFTARSRASFSHDSASSSSSTSKIAPSSMSMSTTLVNSLQPAATYSPTRFSAFSTRSFSFFSFSSRRRCIFTARRKSLNDFISAISSRVFCTSARCVRKNDSSSSAPSKRGWRDASLSFSIAESDGDR